ncbi:MAG: M14 family metallopeptidase [Deinococcota bacterium]
MTSLFENLHWHRLELAGHAATSKLELHYGEVGQDGPLATLVAGVHGDEGPWGALAIQKLLERPLSCLTGRLRIILAANPLAAEANSRNAPLDVLDLNRTFPGDTRGSHTERLAAELAQVIDGSDLVIDLHGGGSWCVNAFTFAFAGFELLAELVGAPFILTAPDKQGTLSHYASAQGAKVVAIEMGGCSAEEMHWRTRIARGLERILVHEGMLELATSPPPSSLKVGSSQVMRPRSGGIFVPSLRKDAVGTVVARGRELGKLLDLYTLTERELFTAPYDQTALLLLRPHVAVLEGGAMTYVVAEVSS